MKILEERRLINDFKEADDGKPWCLDEIIEFIRDTEKLPTCGKGCKECRKYGDVYYCTYHQHTVRRNGFCDAYFL